MPVLSGHCLWFAVSWGKTLPVCVTSTPCEIVLADKFSGVSLELVGWALNIGGTRHKHSALHMLIPDNPENSWH